MKRELSSLQTQKARKKNFRASDSKRQTRLFSFFLPLFLASSISLRNGLSHICRLGVSNANCLKPNLRRHSSRRQLIEAGLLHAGYLARFHVRFQI